MPADVKCTTTQTSSNDCSYPNCACGEPPKNKSSANGCGSSSCSCGSSCGCKAGECKC
ncbi:hypothetical protein OH76DRAFT_1401883 [Lentinus brumalis]|uniref:Metallothionein n=1 Tax=Lentinus brumalis TaxID=2498619 RepID=A0A371DF35_9APHY|nr:hypothetical protein OH76DRAFT_1401883 [Polyporus brumalis]